jgi:hypothetical protein
VSIALRMRDAGAVVLLGGGLGLGGLTACGDVKSQAQDAAVVRDVAVADAWLSSCVSTQLITTIESNDPAFGNECLHGSWYLQSPNGTTMPPAPGQPNNTAPVIPATITIGTDPLDPASTYAVHVLGSGQQNMGTVFSFAQLTVSLNTLSETQVGNVDASAYTGVQFYGIINTAASGARLTVADLYTDPSGGMCTIASGAKACFDNPGAQLTPSTTWTKYQVPFASLTQLGFGNPSPLGVDFPKRAIVDLKWDIGIPSTGATAPWEIWVDDLTFY